MITEYAFIKIALSFPSIERKPHFERIGFKVIGKRMFTTYLAENNTCNVFLTPKEQARFCKKDPENIYAVPNKWGENGATTLELDTIDKKLLMEALQSAYDEVVKVKKKK
jgi:hypothetical protein